MKIFPMQWIYLPLSFSVYIYFRYSLFTMVEITKQPPDETMAFIIVGCCVLIITLIFANENYANYQYKQLEVQNLQNLLLRQYEEYLQNNNTNNEIRRMYHDIRNHLTCIAECESKEEAKKYVDSIHEQISAYSTIINTNNHILDVILTDKKQKARAINISLEINVDFSKGDFIEAMDICTIFANALDNAIEACDKVHDQNKRKIVLKANVVHCFLAIRIENYFAGEVKYADDKIISSKNDNFYHGWGLPSIKLTIQKYHGEISVKQNDDLFILSIMLPLPDNK